VYSGLVARTVAEALAVLDSRRAFVVHGFAGVDELSPAGPNLVFEVHDGEVRERVIDPQELGIEPCAPADLQGGSPDENARTAREIVAGARGAKRDAVALNAAGAIAAAGHAGDLREGLAVATETIDSGAAAARLEELVEFSRQSA
jgi:anthranilate phosphoribosyltransferase